MADVRDISLEALLLSHFKNGYYKLNASNLTESDMNGGGILVAETTVFDVDCSTGQDGKYPPPSEDEQWEAGFFHPMPAKNMTIKSGTVYIGRK